MPRPPLPPEKRRVTLAVRVDPETRGQIEMWSLHYKMTMGQIIDHLASHGKVIPPWDRHQD